MGQQVRHEQQDERTVELTESGRATGAAAGESIGGAVGQALGVAGTALGAAGNRLKAIREDASPLLDRVSQQAEPARRAAVQGVAQARAAGQRLSDAGASELLQDVRTGALSVQSALDGVVEDARGRSADVLARLTRRPPRRWPWAVGAAVAGAAAGAAGALVARAVLGRDAPGAQEPEQLRAVVDLPAEPVEDLPTTPSEP